MKTNSSKNKGASYQGQYDRPERAVRTEPYRKGGRNDWKKNLQWR